MMSLENLFVKEYEKANRKNEELEKQLALYKFENKALQCTIDKCVWLLKKTNPANSSNGVWLNGVLVYEDDDKQEALKLLKHLGIELKKINEVEKR